MKKALSILMALAIMIGMFCIPTNAYDNEAYCEATYLHSIGLFRGRSSKTLNFALDSTATRAEAVTMIVRLLGKEEEALATPYKAPFTDVDKWAKPYVNFAYFYDTQITKGTSATKFSGNSNVTPEEFTTMILRVIGYKDGTDFVWRNPFKLSNSIGLTKGLDLTSPMYRRIMAIICGRTLSMTYSYMSDDVYDIYEMITNVDYKEHAKEYFIHNFMEEARAHNRLGDMEAVYGAVNIIPEYVLTALVNNKWKFKFDDNNMARHSIDYENKTVSICTNNPDHLIYEIGMAVRSTYGMYIREELDNAYNNIPSDISFMPSYAINSPWTLFTASFVAYLDGHLNDLKTKAPNLYDIVNKVIQHCQNDAETILIPYPIHK